MSTIQTQQLAVTLAGIPLSTCLINVPEGGPATADEVGVACGAPIGAVVTPPIAAGELDDPAGTVRGPHHTLAAQDTGVVGYGAYVDVLDACTRSGKPTIATVTGHSPEEICDTALRVAHHEIDMISLDLSRRPDRSARYLKDRRIFGLRVDLVTEMVHRIREGLPKSLPIGIRQPLWLDPLNVQDAAGAIVAAQASFAATATPIGIGMLVDPVRLETVLGAAVGDAPALGRMSGAALAPVAAAEIRLLHRALPDEVTLVGSGGVTDGATALQHVVAGASVVELDVPMSSAQYPELAASVTNDLVSALDRFGLASITDLVGGRAHRTTQHD